MSRLINFTQGLFFFFKRVTEFSPLPSLLVCLSSHAVFGVYYSLVYSLKKFHAGGTSLVIFSYYPLFVYIVTLFSVPFVPPASGRAVTKCDVWRLSIPTFVVWMYFGQRLSSNCQAYFKKLIKSLYRGKFIPTILYDVSFIRQTKLAISKQRTEVQDNLFWLTCSRYKNIYPLNYVILKFQASSEKQIRFIGTLTT